MSRHLSRLILCGLLGGAMLLSGCALVRKDSAPHQQLAPEQIKLADDIHGKRRLATSAVVATI